MAFLTSWTGPEVHRRCACPTPALSTERRPSSSRAQRCPYRRSRRARWAGTLAESGGPSQLEQSETESWIEPRYRAVAGGLASSEKDQVRWLSQEELWDLDGQTPLIRSLGPPGDSSAYYNPTAMSLEELGLHDAPLNPMQKRVVQLLLQGRSVAYSRPGATFDADFAPVVYECTKRAELWQGRKVVYCAPTVAAAQRAFLSLQGLFPTVLRSFLANEVQSSCPPKTEPVITVTTQETLHDMVFRELGEHVDLVFMEDMMTIETQTQLPKWEELLFGAPSRVQFCWLCGFPLTVCDAEEIPVWMGGVHAQTASVVSKRSHALPDQDFLLTFNAATEEVQSLSKTSPKGLVCAVDDLEFGSFEQKEFRDVAAVVVESWQSSFHSRIFPVVVLISGRGECEVAASAIASAAAKRGVQPSAQVSRLRYQAYTAASNLLEESHLLQNDDAAEVVFLSMLLVGIAVSHTGLLPCLRLLGEHLFRIGVVDILIADTQMGVRELASLPRGGSVLVDGAILTPNHEFPDSTGLVHGGLIARLCRQDGAVVAVWDDPEVTVDEAREELMSSLHVERPTVMSAGIGRSFSSVLSMMLRFGKDGLAELQDAQLTEFRKRQEIAPLQAQRQMVNEEYNKTALELQDVPWDDIWDFEKLEADMTEAKNMLRAMVRHQALARSRETSVALSKADPGTIVHVLKNDTDTGSMSTEVLRYNVTGSVEDIMSEMEDTECLVFVSFIGPAGDQEPDCRIACVASNGLWREVQVRDVVKVDTESSNNEEVKSAARKLDAPAVSLFKRDSATGLSTCKPFPGDRTDEVDTLAVAAAMANIREDAAPALPAKILQQRDHTKEAMELVAKNQWAHRREDISSFYSRRQRLSVLADQLSTIDNMEREARRKYFGSHLGCEESENSAAADDRQAVVEVLRDANCLNDEATQVTPFGLAVANLVADEPFWMATVLLLGELDALRPSTLFAAIVACVTDFPPEHGPAEVSDLTGDRLSTISRLTEIRDEVHILEKRRRHSRGNGAVSPSVTAGFVPPRPILDTRLCAAAEQWASGASWDVVMNKWAVDFEPGDVLCALRKACSVLQQVADAGRLPMITSELRESAQAACDSASRFPVTSDSMFAMLRKNGFLGSIPMNWNDSNRVNPPKRGRGRRKKTQIEADRRAQSRCATWWSSIAPDGQ